MGTEIFKKIAAWYRENRKYDGFIQFEAFGLLTVFLLVINICRLSTNPVDWLFVLLELVITLFYVERWMGEMKFEAFRDFTRELMDVDHSLTKAVMARCEAEHRWLVSANRRRKRAEKQLKWYRNTLRNESAERLGFEVKADEYEFYLLIAQCAIVNDAPDRRDKFLAWMKKHPDIEERQAKRQYLTSLYESFLFGDACIDPKEAFDGLITVFGQKPEAEQP